MRAFHLFLAFLLTLGLAACASNPNNQSSEYGTQGQGTSGSRYGADTGAGSSMQTTPGTGNAQTGANQQKSYSSPFDNPNNKLSKSRIYFGFDSSTIAPKYKAILRAHANYLTNHPKANVRLQGNTDERGSREYNMGLGQRRAKSVAHYLELQGVSASHITVISYGEERPLALGHNKKAWAKNRRVKIVYTNRESE